MRKVRADRRWFPCSCNCKNCRESGSRVAQLAGIAGNRNVVMESGHQLVLVRATWYLAEVKAGEEA